MISIEDIEDALYEATRAVVGPAQLATPELVDAIRDRSARYTSERSKLAKPTSAKGDLAARAVFFTITDAPKIAIPIAELLSRDALPITRPLRVVDLGAGCGAMSLGLIASLDVPLSITAIDRDRDALGIAASAIRALTPSVSTTAPSTSDASPRDASTSDASTSDPSTSDPSTSDASTSDASTSDSSPRDASTSNPSTSDASPRDASTSNTSTSNTSTSDTSTSNTSTSTTSRISFATRVDDALSGAIPKCDLVVMGTLLNELPSDAARLSLVERALAAIGDDGAVIIIEPALRDTTRALHGLRDALIARGKGHVFAPCTRQGAPCPALADPTDWCHEHRAIGVAPKLPPRTHELARLTHLRDDGLKLSYLVLRKQALSIGDDAWRIVGTPWQQKGKLEVLACGNPGRVTLRLLKRNRGASNRAIEDVSKGHVVRIHQANQAATPSDDARPDHFPAGNQAVSNAPPIERVEIIEDTVVDVVFPRRP